MLVIGSLVTRDTTRIPLDSVDMFVSHLSNVGSGYSGDG